LSLVHIFTTIDFKVKSKLNHFSVIPCSSRILIMKLNLIWKAAKAESCTEYVIACLLRPKTWLVFSFYCHFSVIPCSSGILLLKLHLIPKAVKAESCAGFEERRWDEGRLFFLSIVTSRWFHVQVEFCFSSCISFRRPWRPSWILLFTLHLIPKAVKAKSFWREIIFPHLL